MSSTAVRWFGNGRSVPPAPRRPAPRPSGRRWRVGGRNCDDLRVPAVRRSCADRLSPATTNVPIGTTWNYVIGISGGNRINLTVDGSSTSYPFPSSFNQDGMYFKAGSYNQSSSAGTTNGAKIKFYALTVFHA